MWGLNFVAFPFDEVSTCAGPAQGVWTLFKLLITLNSCK